MIIFEVAKLKEELSQFQRAQAKGKEVTPHNLRYFSRVQEKLDTYEGLVRAIDELQVLAELAPEDDQLREEFECKSKQIEQKLKTIEIEELLSGPHDRNNCILTIHPGSGGTESCDWAQMLLRMYTRWATSHGYRVQTLDLIINEQAGIKSATVIVCGDYAYGYLRCEAGVHRLVRISPFDANRRRHTSFAAVYTLPEIDEVQVQLDLKDLKIETFRASGPGGQHVNVTESAVKITHIPTGISAQSQSERSQHQNKAKAMKILRARLYEYYQKQQKEQIEKIAPAKCSISWGRQIRSYVLYPYKLVKDHRTQLETPNIQQVLDGEIDEFIHSYLLLNKKTKNKIL